MRNYKFSQYRFYCPQRINNCYISYSEKISLPPNYNIQKQNVIRLMKLIFLIVSEKNFYKALSFSI